MSLSFRHIAGAQGAHSPHHTEDTGLLSAVPAFIELIIVLVLVRHRSALPYALATFTPRVERLRTVLLGMLITALLFVTAIDELSEPYLYS